MRIVHYVFIFLLLCIVSSCKSDHKPGSLDEVKGKINGQSKYDLVKYAVINRKIHEDTKCGYYISDNVYYLYLCPWKKNEKFEECTVSKNDNILLNLCINTAIQMSGGDKSNTCNHLSNNSIKSIDSYKEMKLLIDDVFVDDFTNNRYYISGCPDPILKNEEFDKDRLSVTNGYFILLNPFKVGKHQIKFSSANICWTDERDDKNGKCPQTIKKERRAISLILNVKD